MDPNFSDPDSEAEAAAMAAAMGFSAFGKAPAAKKRKFNPANDAFVEGDDLAKLDKGGKKGKGSGGNEVPLGKPRVFGATKQEDQKVVVERRKGGNAEEIDLEDDEETVEGDKGSHFMDTSRTPPAEEIGSGASHFIDTSPPPPLESGVPRYTNSIQNPPVSEAESAEMQARIDAILARIGSNDPPGSTSPPKAAALLGPPPGLPQRPAFVDTTSMSGENKPGRTAPSVGSGSRPTHRPSGQRNEFWYVDYYDRTFNENPWASLEKEKGLQPLGSWPQG